MLQSLVIQFHIYLILKYNIIFFTKKHFFHAYNYVSLNIETLYWIEIQIRYVIDQPFWMIDVVLSLIVCYRKRALKSQLQQKKYYCHRTVLFSFNAIFFLYKACFKSNNVLCRLFCDEFANKFCNSNKTYFCSENRGL